MNRYYSQSRRRFRGPSNNSSYINDAYYVKKADPVIETEKYIPITKYENLNINDKLKDNIKTKGYLEPTPIQDKAIQPILDGKDIIGIAKTGTGKTAAFLIPLIEKIYNNKKDSVVIIVPTRELAVQINDEFKALTRNMKLFSVVCIGGTNIMAQVRSFKYEFNFVIATPGRLKDLIKRNYLSMESVKYVVCDEVDRMFDMGFGPDVRFLLDQMPKSRQSLFFSATLSKSIEDLFIRYLNNPIKVEIQSANASNNIEQDVVKVPAGKVKMDVLHDLLIKEEFKKVLIFGKTKWGVKSIHRELEFRGFKVDSLHGNKTQSQRQRSLTAFKENKVTILVATDVAARGIDVRDITHVINYDLPATKEDYIHRIGRTGRANKTGTALTFLN